MSAHFAFNLWSCAIDLQSPPPKYLLGSKRPPGQRAPTYLLSSEISSADGLASLVREQDRFGWLFINGGIAGDCIVWAILFRLSATVG